MTDLLSEFAEFWNSIINAVIDFAANSILFTIFGLPAAKAEEQGSFILSHLYYMCELFNIENFLTFFVGFVFFIFCFKIALKVISIIRG